MICPTCKRRLSERIGVRSGNPAATCMFQHPTDVCPDPSHDLADNAGEMRDVLSELVDAIGPIMFDDATPNAEYERFMRAQKAVIVLLARSTP